MINILFIGDIIAKFGRHLVRDLVPELKKEYKIDLVIGNGENAAHGNGLTLKVYQELVEAGLDVITTGNHLFDKREFIRDIDACPLVVRPANYPARVPGKDHIILETEKGPKVGVLNLMGRVFMPDLDNPFPVADSIVAKIRKETPIVIVDIHAEATSEKVAMGWYLDGRVSAVIGTHTHVQTADDRILPNGTAYLSDAGMVGPLNSVIGVEVKPIIERFLTGVNFKFETEREGPGVFGACVVSVDEKTGRAHTIQRIYKVTNPREVAIEATKEV